MLHVIVGLYAIFVLPLYCRYFFFPAPKGHKSKQKRLEVVCFDTPPEKLQASNIIYRAFLLLSKYCSCCITI